MAPKDFYNQFIGYARESERQTGVPALFTLAQAALESGWGEHVKANNFFGVKDTDGINGNEVEFLTTEYNQAKKVWMKVKQWFRAYSTPAQSFIDHGLFLKKNKRYSSAFLYRNNDIQFAIAVAKAGYATDPNYAQKVKGIISMLKKTA